MTDAGDRDGVLDVDTIAAISTARGSAAIANVRVSGPAAADVLRALAPRLAGSLPEPRRATLVELRDPDDSSPLDRAVVTWYPGPGSYTGEDLVELSCHGGRLVPDLVLDACLRAGARPAEAGELTRRAYLRGKIDLIQAEATADLIEARSRAAQRAALGQLERGLSDRLARLRRDLVHLEALLVHHIDFPEEDDAPVPVERVAAEAARVVGELDALLATAPEGELLREGALTVFAGRPNVGKSSLYNALLGEERAIVTEEPGTTRDALEASVQLGGFPFRLVDTAGLRETDARVERLGIEVARRYLDRADVVLLCTPASVGLTDGDRAFLATLSGVPVVVVLTQADLASADATVERAGGGAAPPRATPDAAAYTPQALGIDVPALRDASGPRIFGPVAVSVVSGEGLDRLRALLPELVYAGVARAGAEAPVLTRRRHVRALEVARREVEAFRAGLVDGLPAEVASTHLRPAETALEELLGVVSVDDVLDVVFREFCVGK